VTRPSSTVAVIDDDVSVRESLPDLLHELGFSVYTFASAQEFLSFDAIATIRCLITDVAMSPMSGLDLQVELKRRGYQIPIVFISGHPDDALRRLVRDQGGAECLFKPFTDTALLAAISAALGVDGAAETARNGEKP
jgi:FixJ family two-component response regulator